MENENGCLRVETKTLSEDSTDEDDAKIVDGTTCVRVGQKRKMEEPESANAIKISAKAQKMMKNMGYVEGSGLGKHSQGIVTPVQSSKQKGRRGLGAVIKEIDKNLITFDANLDVCQVDESVSWLMGGGELDIQSDWLQTGGKKFILDDEIFFCDEDVLRRVLACKTALDSLSGEELRRARFRSNPFELLKNGIFLNRAALKMTNMDHSFNYIFTDPKGRDGSDLVSKEELFYFADVCAGPGGFSEYVLWKKQWKGKGFGFTLKGDNDFTLEKFFAAPCESFEPYYGSEEDGDVCKSENISSFEKFVKDQTNGRGVHFMMADGGFSVEGRENIQEIMSKQLYLCQFLTALRVVRNEGTFLCKLFDIFTPFSVALVYLMYRSFGRISIHKPNTSRPANSERYIVCQWKKTDVDHISDYMFRINHVLNTFEGENEDVTDILPLDLMTDDEIFYDYMKRSNNLIGLKQINSLAKLLKYAQDDSLVDGRQADLRVKCLEAWKVPLNTRFSREKFPPDYVARQLLHNDTLFMRAPVSKISDANMKWLQPSMYNWFVSPLSSDPSQNFPSLFLVSSRRRCYRWTNKWEAIALEGLPEISPNTLFLGEICKEYYGVGTTQLHSSAIHIIDAHTLGGIPVDTLHYQDRLKQCELFVESMNKVCAQSIPMRVKEAFKLENIYESVCEKLVEMRVKPQYDTKEMLPINAKFIRNNHKDCHILLNGFFFIKCVKDPYNIHYSNREKRIYYFADGKSVWERPDDAALPFKEAFPTCYLWFRRDGGESPLRSSPFIQALLQCVEKRGH